MNYIKWIRSKVGNDKIFLNFAGGCIVNDKGEILLQKRKDKKMWGFPGGAMELGESIEETVKREVKEETGLVVETKKFIGVYSKYVDRYPSGDEAQTILHFFELEIVDGALSTDDEETLELTFFDPENMPKLVNKQHEDALADYVAGVSGVVR